MRYLTNVKTPQLKKIHSGKVRESFRIDEKTRMIVATDRISCFDQVLKTPIPGKGAVLNQLAAYWFENTRDIINNHLIEVIDPNISLVREAKPIKIEMVVRGYLTGSAWRKYQRGSRVISGVKIPDGMRKNQPFSQPIITPTTKEESDREISKEELIKEGWATTEIYEEMTKIAIELFTRGQKMLNERGIIIVDTKYEFGLIGDELVLIDEIHTPDSSRFWLMEDYRANPDNVEQLDKEYVRNYLMENKIDGKYPETLPEEVVKETVRRYKEIYEIITGTKISEQEEDVYERIYKNLVKHGIIKDGIVAIIMGSESDIEHCLKIRKIIEKYDIAVDMRIASAHKNGEYIVKIADEYNSALEPCAIIAVAGRSNGLGGALAANSTVPVINCPPFKDKVDLLININSSLMMPSKTPTVTVIDPENAALAAMRSLNINRLKCRFVEDIEEMKISLINADTKIREKKNV